jgi:hypothetical protein
VRVGLGRSTLVAWRCGTVRLFDFGLTSWLAGVSADSGGLAESGIMVEIKVQCAVLGGAAFW